MIVQAVSSANRVMLPRVVIIDGPFLPLNSYNGWTAMDSCTQACDEYFALCHLGSLSPVTSGSRLMPCRGR